jgi:hypothetical protein
MTPGLKKRFLVSFAVLTSIVACGFFFVSKHPLVFNESFLGHAHCIKGAGLDLNVYADEHGGKFPFHPNGYGDALLLINNGWDVALAGPGYDTQVFDRARRTREDAPENEFGRVYVQGLSVTSDPDIAILFDKLPTPGGDHCHLFQRMFAPLGREIWTVGTGMSFVPERHWPVFAEKQIELLVAEGITREQAAKYYSENQK